ncbi:unnamed protein product [Vicia faba]|uniref:Reverse transcriptase zinc-binding domain-containing protein n=1 Tax=Vicia faba TaxID=3906 RepID=A0AAV1AUI7_VICFA|nr:unnamed protein product [Vicia faba]
MQPPGHIIHSDNTSSAKSSEDWDLEVVGEDDRFEEDEISDTNTNEKLATGNGGGGSRALVVFDEVFRETQASTAVSVDIKDYLEIMWRTKIPPRIQIFACRLFLNRLLSKDQLKKRTILNNSSDLNCVQCLMEEDNIGHFMFACPISMKDSRLLNKKVVTHL